MNVEPNRSGERGRWTTAIHRGDCRDVLKGLRDENGGPGIHLTVTSPPYNVGQDYANYDDNRPYTEYMTTMREVFAEVLRSTVKGGRLAVNVPEGVNVPAGKEERGYHPLHHDLDYIIRYAGWKPFGAVLWYKHQILKRTAWGSFARPSSPSFVYSWEHVMVYYRDTRKLEPPEGNPAPDITKEEFIAWTDGFWDITPETRDLDHPCPFPEELVRRLVLLLTWPGMSVLDPFCGTGTTPYVAHSLGREGIGIDISETYVRAASERLKGSMKLPGRQGKLSAWV